MERSPWAINPISASPSPPARRCNGKIAAGDHLFLRSQPIEFLLLVGRGILEGLTERFAHFAESLADVGGGLFGFEETGGHACCGVLRLESIALARDAIGLFRFAGIAQLDDLAVEFGKVGVDLRRGGIRWIHRIGGDVLLKRLQGVLRLLAAGEQHKT